MTCWQLGLFVCRFPPKLKGKIQDMEECPGCDFASDKCLAASLWTNDQRLAVRTLVVAEDDKALQGQPEVGL